MKTVLFLFLLLNFINLQAEEKSAKVVFVGKRIINVGNVKKGEIVKKVITFKNGGNDTLIINEIGKSCTCTNATISKKELKPDETSEIIIEVDTSEKWGEYKATVSFTTNIKPKEYIVMVIMNVV